MLRKLAVVLLGIAIVFVFACVFLASRRPEIAGPLPPLTKTTVDAAEARLKAALTPPSDPVDRRHDTSKLHKAAVVRSTPVSNKPIAISVSESDVNIMLAGNAQVIGDLAKQGVTDAQVAFLDPDQVEATGVVARAGGYHSITVDGTLSLNEDGSVTYVPNSVRLGALPIPESAVDKIVRQESTRLLHAGLVRLPITVSSFVIKNQKLILTGKRKPH